MTDTVAMPARAGVGDGAAAERRAVSRAEFRACYDRYFTEIAAYGYRLTHDTELARDLAQEAFTRLFGRWIAVRHPRPYLYLVVTNLARDSWRTSARERQARESLERDQGLHPAVPATDLSVSDAVERLPAAQRDVVLLYYYGDLPVAEVARVVRRPEGTVKRLLAEARDRLAEALGGRA